MQGDFFAKRRRNSLIFIAILLLLTFASIIITEYNVVKGFTSVPKAVQWAFSNFYPNEKAMNKLPDILVKLKKTVLMSIAATTVAAVFAFLFAILGSHTTRINGFFSSISRAIATVFRNIDVAAWAMILLFSFGQSELTGYFALFFGSFGFLTRAFMETIDEISSSSVEALKATGANYFPIIIQSVIPSSISRMISWILFMVETNIRQATLIGILTGTGIGFSFSLYYKSLNYHAASLVVIVVIAAILIIEYISNYVRRVIM
ncbi:PhnE/PtxC family ABC transporter permease [Paenibacillus piri]|uniref:ABC transporter permease subunit n=1 Tax=Paenibacillus piri TaxID=2547395 RepID=A0A4R5KU84_9BACL|nr:ABC transporter permease subunit [Paenibacillus piri]TDF98658.1 ABC transporter permease subunit [Paenibacillus piri]